MAVFDSLNETSNKAVSVGETYLKKSEAYYKLKAFQLMSLSLSTLCKVALIGVFVFLAIMLLSVAAAIAIGNALENMAMGCLIVAGFYFLLAVIAYSLRKRIDNLLIKNLSIDYFSENHEDL